MTLLIGSEGSMGKRYRAILKDIGEPFCTYDPIDNNSATVSSQYDRFIIASPTETHMDWIRQLDQYNKPILCEKPISKNLDEVKEILTLKSPITVQMQYMRLVNKYDTSVGAYSRYDYFNHGKDGLVWDCFQIIALSTGKVELKENSPVWECTINGCDLDLAAMDRAYVGYVRDWIEGKEMPGPAQIYQWHEKVKDFEEKWINIQV